jgi:hypothetical protein
MSVIYVQTSGEHLSNSFGQPTPIPGLSLTLPEGSGEQALVILNVPNPYAWSPGNLPAGAGGWFGISVDGKTLPAVAAFTYVAPTPMLGAAGRVPTTLIVAVPLVLKPQKIVALWLGTGAAVVRIDSPASLSAFL